MESTSIWLIHHKASLSLDSPLNMDGSDYMVGVGVVPARGMEEAVELFKAYLREQRMGVLAIKKCEQYDPRNFAKPTQGNTEIKEVATEALETGQVFYACGISSEALGCMDDEHE